MTGSLIQKKEGTPGDDIFIGMTVVNRDSGKDFKVKALLKVGEKQLVNLLGADGNKVSLNLADFKEKLTTEGSPWRRK